MIRRIRKTTSIKNFLTASCSGQVATLLTLAMVIVLIIIVATIKVGNISNKATTLANAADSSALLLASQLSTKAYQLWDSLEDDPNDGQGTTEKCKKSSFLSMLLGAIFAIICIVVLSILWPGMGTAVGAKLAMMIMIASAAAAGAVGGAVGAMVSGTNVLQGAAQGAAIGAAIGGIAAGTIGIMNPAFFANTAAFAPASSALFLSTSTLAGAIGTGVMGLGSTLYKAMSEANATDKSLSEAARALNGLSEKGTYRESVFLNALSQTIEDQNTTKTMGICKAVIDGEKEECGEDDKYDPYDADNDGDQDEIISYFSYWWDRRIKDLKRLFPKLKSRTQDFIKCDTAYQLYACEAKNNKGGNCEDKKEDNCWQTKAQDEKVPLKDFRYFAQEQYSAAYECKYSTSYLSQTGYEGYAYNPCASYVYSDEYSAGSYYPSWTPGPLYRSGLTEWKKYLMNNLDSPASRNTCGYDSSSSSEQFKQYRDTLGAEPAGSGVVVAVAEALEVKGIGVSFYKSGLKTREEEDGDDSKDKDKDTENDNGFCDSCALEPYHDEVEAVTSELNSLVDSVKDLNKQSTENLASTWESWIKWYYDEGVTDKDEETCEETVKENTGDYYDTLRVLIDGEDLNGNGVNGEKDVTITVPDEDGNDVEWETDELQGIRAWQKELKKQKAGYIKKLPECEVNPLYYYVEGRSGGSAEVDYYNNYPCYDSANKIISLDGDQEDEFEEAVTALETLIDEIGEGDDPPKGSIRYEMKKYDTDMNNLYNSSTINFGGRNPVTYRWRDSACPASLTDSEDWDNDCDTGETGFCHSIKVQTSDFKVPWVKKESSSGFLSKKVCLVLTDYCYDPDKKHIVFPNGSPACENSYNPVSVTITKKDITRQAMGILGKFSQQDESDACENLTEEEKEAKAAEDKQVSDNDLERVTIKKKAKAYFSYYKLGLEDTK